jgi:hypothetical protein
MRFRQIISCGSLIGAVAAWSAVAADAQYVFIEGAVSLPHPLAGENLPGNPPTPAEALFSQQSDGNLEVSLRITGTERGERKEVGLLLWIKNLNADAPVTIRPLVNVSDSTGRVTPILDMRRLMEAARSARASGSWPSQSFFAAGNQNFVNSPIAGYAIGSVLQVAMGVSRNQQAEQAMRVWDTHWLKDEYRLPPGGKDDAVASLNGFPALPMTVRITVGDRVFKFDSVSTF